MHRKPRQQSERKRSRRTDHRSDRGSATVWAVGAIAVLCVIFGALLAMGQTVVIRHRAAGAADLAALAAADHWTTGTDAACGMAERVARAQGTRLVRCAIEGETSDVTAASGKGPFSAEARSRAGPAGPVAPGLVAPGPVAPGPVAPGPTAPQAPAPNAPHTERARPGAVSPPVPPATAP
ncbi:flp pilus-assembly TadE/G-like family protein [Streptomyces sp. KM273126]|uniref:Rv3654c family TadE-like protein n=1 Tax=Streptomyces sp. KM273126 TaxID=2545247 RepID=UPI00103CF469|nr:Rv3654c family TadE-like protein [Streptomyces sp. KM273126]MBA2807998.1 flp pilus-assembly TadE/G-like family protein [Streptomyces sp. KM273126]